MMGCRLLAPLAIVAALAGGCRTAAGNYFANWARDFGGARRRRFSPGEFVDFVLGWFGVDIADDDRALQASSIG